MLSKKKTLVITMCAKTKKRNAPKTNSVNKVFGIPTKYCIAPPKTKTINKRAMKTTLKNSFSFNFIGDNKLRVYSFNNFQLFSYIQKG